MHAYGITRMRKVDLQSHAYVVVVVDIVVEATVCSTSCSLLLFLLLLLLLFLFLFLLLLFLLLLLLLLLGSQRPQSSLFQIIGGCEEEEEEDEEEEEEAFSACLRAQDQRATAPRAACWRPKSAQIAARICCPNRCTNMLPEFRRCSDRIYRRISV